MDPSVSSPPPSLIFYPTGQYLPGVNGLVLQSPATSFNVTGLRPFGEYSFQVVCVNEIGMTASDWTSGRTLEDGER
jgi:hypothetical protein